jgi:hypothetical protein
MSMTNIAVFCLVVSSLPLAWPPPKPQQSNGTVKGRRQDVADELLPGFGGEAYVNIKSHFNAPTRRRIWK